MALLLATYFRDEFIRVNRDIMNTFQLLAAGEKLLVGQTWLDECKTHAKLLAAAPRCSLIKQAIRLPCCTHCKTA